MSVFSVRLGQKLEMDHNYRWQFEKLFLKISVGGHKKAKIQINTHICFDIRLTVKICEFQLVASVFFIYLEINTFVTIETLLANGGCHLLDLKCCFG